MRKTETGDIYYKIVYWGASSSGKTTAVDTLFKLVLEDPNAVVTPMGDLTKISTPTGATNYFDRGILKSNTNEKLYYHLYTVAGQTRFQPLRNKVLFGADAIVLVVDSQKDKLEANKDSLIELQNFVDLPLVQKIPLFIMLNKRDLPNIISQQEWIDIMEELGVYFPKKHPLHEKNSPIFETVALSEIQQNIYESFNNFIGNFEKSFKNLGFR
ncbi:MAG: ADP-ribosylation factor-like protein [Promethearchaeota archaeon]